MRSSLVAALTAFADAAPDDPHALALVTALLAQEVPLWGVYLDSAPPFAERVVAWRARHLAREMLTMLPPPPGDVDVARSAAQVRRAAVACGASVLGLACTVLSLLARGPCGEAALAALAHADDCRASFDGSILPEQAEGVE